MSATFTSNSYIVAELETTGTGVYGTGSRLTPMLRLHGTLKLSAPNGANRALVFADLTAKLAFQGQEQTSIASLPCRLNVRRDPEHPGPTPHSFSLDFPINMALFGQIENIRAGTDLVLKLTPEISAFRYAYAPVANAGFDAPLGGLLALETLRTSMAIEVKVFKSHWIEHVLPAFGFGSVTVVEFPAVPVEACAAFADSLTALKHAQRFHAEGHYNQAVAQCRLALEPILEANDEGKGKRLKKSWEIRLGASTYAWLKTAVHAVNDRTNKPHHSNQRFDQLESQMLLAVTTAFVAYIARLERDPGYA
ncbi:MAG TPA: hypothetical protein DCQ94_16420 [Nitrospira sp.]|nr:hypothetical protein [Nitrospira sp.]HRJ46473.1 hypothetical protein [Opitutaceae bacterium]